MSGFAGVFDIPSKRRPHHLTRQADLPSAADIQTIVRGQMSADAINDTNLTWQVLTSKRPGLSRGLPPGKEDLAWVANSVTLISGQRDAVLVDTFLTRRKRRHWWIG
jgi:hypothetical protein